ncbi:hypothetical protein CENSYa_0836 [Cenarchaeum symbiosum A]|uniref:Uncharacterized protein n=1 Tax=Cenarchaeum symbiosum (strain A) TaxID=414004 RepID=A0RVV2_CENSY|nr:hypothetical protein CENSYa_0836 [Cenarchaeum symbiosum A]
MITARHTLEWPQALPGSPPGLCLRATPCMQAARLLIHSGRKTPGSERRMQSSRGMTALFSPGGKPFNIPQC